MVRLPGPFARFAPVLACGVLIVGVSTFTRLLFALRPDVGGAGGLADWGRIFGLGLLYDLVVAGYMLAPFALWLSLTPDRLARTRLHRTVIAVVVLALAYGVVLLGVMEWLFWNEFGGRFNFIAVDYLLYTHEVIGNIRESYPVGPILLALLLPAALFTTLIMRRVWRPSAAPLSWRAAGGAALVYGLALAGSLRFVDADLKNFSPSDSANALAGNGAYEFFAANYRNELSYDRHYATLPIEDAMSTVRAALDGDGSRWVAPQRIDLERDIRAGRPERRLNVVLVSVESLGAEFLGAYGDRRGLTPNLDRLARESLWFSNVYATGNRTVRGLEALALALPPTPGQSIVRRPKNEALFSLGSVFEDKGYGVLFAYGGYGYFDNMNAFFDANDYRSIDRRSIPAKRIEFENIWGVADEHLFDQVLDEIDRARAERPERPVFAHVMTTSNHRPYTYPQGRIDIPSGTNREGAVKYTDYALGCLLERARSRAWFDDTVFIITADHGANARGTTSIPVDKYRIPVFVYAPRHIAPRRIDRLMSQIDIAPTLLGLLDFSYYSKFVGRDVLRSAEASDRAFVANYQTLGYLKGDRMAVLHPKRRVEVFRLADGMRVRVPVDDPGLAREAIAFYALSSYAFHNGLYRDEEQRPPLQRASAPPPHGRPG
ncbi:MAG: hypothetical protein AMJ64_13905 [Betaproteobacteria bacterium SG8_39]|nr:MAG: hypothetical protein AMJ64_13905 [Betaproteobacteria bacterium SG8_39]